MPKFGTKNPWFMYFWARIWKQYCHIWNQHPWIGLIVKYWEIMKIPRIGTKSVLFQHFWAKTLKNYCHIWNQHHRISVIAKLWEETKIPKFGTKNSLFGIFGLKFVFTTILEWIFTNFHCFALSEFTLISVDSRLFLVWL